MHTGSGSEWALDDWLVNNMAWQWNIRCPSLSQSRQKSPFSKVKSTVNSLYLEYSLTLMSAVGVSSQVEVKRQFIYTEGYVKSMVDGAPKDTLQVRYLNMK